MTDRHSQHGEDTDHADPDSPAVPAASDTNEAARGIRMQRGGSGAGPMRPMGMPVEKSLNFGPSSRRLLARMAPERALLGLVGLLALSSVAMAVIGPKIFGRATDIIFRGVIGAQLPPGSTLQQAIDAAKASGNNHIAGLLSGMHVVPGAGVDFTALSHVLMLAVALYALSAVLGYLQGYVLNGVVQRTVFTLREDVEAKLDRLPLAYFDREQPGEILSRVTNDIDNVSQSLQQTLSQLLVAILTVVGVIVMMLVISPLLALITLLAVPLSLLVTRAIARRSQPKFVAQWRHTGELNGQVEEAYTGHALVKVFGRQRDVASTFAEKNEELFRASFGAQFVSGIIMPAMMFIGNLTYVFIAVVGGLRVASGTMSLGDVQAFIQYSRQFTQPLTQIASMANLLQSGVASAERVFELLDEPEQVPDPPGAEPVRAPRGQVAFEHVSFRYDPDRPLIDDLSLVAAPGQTVAIVGPTGAGKTTLVNLIMRFYELSSGRITLDGRDIASMTRADLRSNIGMVLQDTWLFNGTIRENIGYGRPGASEAELRGAAEATYVDRFVGSLPDGYDTVIDEEGSNISSGEKQLMTIARAFLADPALLILDEATSSVDTRTEVLVQHAMAALRTDRTSFVIAHRLSTIRDADLILVMRDGTIVEQGTHESLLQAHGAYFDLYNAQFSSADAEELAPAGR